MRQSYNEYEELLRSIGWEWEADYPTLGKRVMRHTVEQTLQGEIFEYCIISEDGSHEFTGREEPNLWSVKG